MTRGLRRMKTETDKEIVASNEAPRKIKFKADESSACKDGIGKVR